MTQTLRLITAALALALAAAACGSSSPATTTTPATPSARTATAARTSTGSAAHPVTGHADIAIRNYMYMPMHLYVRAGTQVSFHNDDQTAHTATAINQSFDTGTIEPGKTATVTFKKPGTYAYHCLFHAFMTATITVVAARS